MTERKKEPCVCGVAYDSEHLSSCDWYKGSSEAVIRKLRTDNAKLRKKNKALVEFLKDDRFSLVDRISSTIRTLDNDDGLDSLAGVAEDFPPAIRPR